MLSADDWVCIFVVCCLDEVLHRVLLVVGWCQVLYSSGFLCVSSYYLILPRVMAPHSSTVAWKIPWIEEPGGLQSMGSHRVGHDWETSLSLFTFIKRLFSSSSLSAIRVVSSAYLRSLIFLPAILIPACASSSQEFHMMYSAYKLNKQGDREPWRTPFPIWNQSVVPCPVLTVASWPAYRFFKRQVRWSSIPISLRIFHSLLWSTQSKALA